jgi:hypothetical protein
VGPRGKVPSARPCRCGRKGNCITRWFPRGNNMASCTFHAHSMHPPVLIPPVETSKSDCTLWYPAPLRGVFGKTFLRHFCGATSFPCRTSEHDTAILSRTRTCGFHASLLQDALRIKFELPVTTWETSNHLCTLQELAVFMEARYWAELLWHTRDN